MWGCRVTDSRKSRVSGFQIQVKVFFLSPIAKQKAKNRRKLFLQRFTVVFLFFTKRKKSSKKETKKYFSKDLLLFFTIK
jgi:hypothetical protein